MNPKSVRTFRQTCAFRLATTLAIAGLLLKTAGASEGEVTTVLSSRSGAYIEALAGVQETVGTALRVVDLSRGDSIPEHAKVIIAIGGRAAIHDYPRNVALVYCVAPTLILKSDPHNAPRIKVYVSPAPRLLMPRLKSLQPSLVRLGFIYINPAYERYIAEMRREEAGTGIQVDPKQVRSIEQMPDQLRAIKGQVDALWLPPDPALITPQSFELLRLFSLGNSIPLYVPMEGLAEKGATAAVGVSFRDMGRKAGVLAAQLLSGSIVESNIYYGDHVSVVINAEAAAQLGLKIPAGALNDADRVIR